MGDAQPRLVHDFVGVHEQVEIDRPWPPARSLADPAERALDAQEDVKKLARGQGRLGGDGAVQEPRLADHADRVRLLQGRDPDDLDAVLGREELDGATKSLLAWAHVRAETDVGARHLEAPLPGALDDDGRMLDRRIEDDVGLADTDAHALDCGEAPDNTVGDRPREALEQ